MKAEERVPATPERGEADVTEPTGDRPAAVGGAAGAVAHERCVHHPGKAAVARCSTCEEPICLTCAVPVRGRVLGPECLAAELGDPALTAPPDPEPGRAGSWVAVAGAILSVLATFGPWTRTGTGDRILGAWILSVRWSMVAAVAAVALLAVAWWLRAREARGRATILILGGMAVAAASVLAIAFPPTFQAASWGPWLGAVGGVTAVAGAVASAPRERRPGQGV